MFGPFAVHVSVDPFYDLLQVCNQSVYQSYPGKVTPQLFPHEDSRMKQPTSSDFFF